MAETNYKVIDFYDGEGDATEAFQYYSLKPEKREAFLEEVVNLSIHPDSKI
ncbi:MAG: hypothetical protein K6E53_15850 [Lachnospiraceae bacterium]|nr:hypothetical protein [Lachnospiraceae bacterium]